MAKEGHWGQRGLRECKAGRTRTTNTPRLAGPEMKRGNYWGGARGVGETEREPCYKVSR